MRIMKRSLLLLGLIGLSTVLPALSDVDRNHDVHDADELHDDVEKSPISREQLFKVFQGILKGALKVSTIEQQCVRDADRFAVLTEKAVELFNSYSFSNVAEGIRDLGLALTSLTDAMNDCKADIEKISAAIAQLVSPEQLVYVVGTNLVLNGKDIFSEVRTAMFAWKNRDFETFGMALGDLIVKLLIPVPPSPHSSVAIGKMNDTDIAQGLLEGLGSQFPVLDKCIHDNQMITDDLRKAIAMIQSEDPKEVKKGIMLLAVVLERDLVPAMKKCKGAEAEVRRIEEALALLSDPKSFAEHTGKNILVNGKTISKETENAVTAYHNNDGRAFGRALGVVLEKILVGADDVDGLEVEYHDSDGDDALLAREVYV